MFNLLQRAWEEKRNGSKMSEAVTTNDFKRIMVNRRRIWPNCEITYREFTRNHWVESNRVSNTLVSVKSCQSPTLLVTDLNKIFDWTLFQSLSRSDIFSGTNWQLDENLFTIHFWVPAHQLRTTAVEIRGLSLPIRKLFPLSRNISVLCAELYFLFLCEPYT